MENKIDDLIKAIHDLKASQQKIISSVNSQNSKLTSIIEKITELSSRVDTLSATSDSLKSRVNNIEDSLKTITSSSSTFKDSVNNVIISEMLDRQNSLKNVLLFNQPDSTNDNNATISDSMAVCEILSFMALKSFPTSITRLGAPSSTVLRPRPIKLCFSDQRDIFTSQKKLKSSQSWKVLRFSSDKTKSQRDQMFHLREELVQ